VLARLLLMIIGLGVAELYVFIRVGTVVGAGATILLTFVTALVGISLVRSQGLQNALHIRERMEQGEIPAEKLIEGVLLALAGVCLLLPGFITDLAGMILLFPAVRASLAGKLIRSDQFTVMTRRREFHRQEFDVNESQGEQPPHQPDDGKKGRILEGEYKRKD